MYGNQPQFYNQFAPQPTVQQSDPLMDLLGQYSQSANNAPKAILQNQRQVLYEKYLRTPECLKLLQELQDKSERFIAKEMGINQPDNNDLLAKLDQMQKELNELKSKELPKAP